MAAGMEAELRCKDVSRTKLADKINVDTKGYRQIMTDKAGKATGALA